MTDQEGIQLARILNTNLTLRKLELEGNKLGPKSAAEFGQALKVNFTLQYLNLANNNLTVDGQDMWGVIQLFDFLEFNTTLKTLIISNNGLDKECGTTLWEKLEGNMSIVNIDFS